MTEKNLELLRPFDLEAAKRGEAVIDCDGDEAKYIAGPHQITYEIVVDAMGGLGFLMAKASDLRMAPLCWVEGRPVYKGDVLYMTVGIDAGKPFVADLMNGGMLTSVINGTANHHYRAEYLTWTPPKVKREGWGVMRVGRVSCTREEAEAILKQYVGSNILSDTLEGELRVARIEWEEPAA